MHVGVKGTEVSVYQSSRDLVRIVFKAPDTIQPIGVWPKALTEKV